MQFGARTMYSEEQTTAGVAGFGQKQLAWAAPQQTNYGDNTGLPDYWLALMVESPWNQFSILLAFHPRRPTSPQGAHGNIFAWLPANGLTS